MKRQSKVAAGYGAQGSAVTEEDLETLQEEQKHADAEARIEAIRQRNRNNLAELLGQKLFIQEWTHPCLLHPELKRQVSVSEFYPDLNTAIDKFYHFDEWEMSLTKFKKEALNKAGFKYAVVTPDKDFADIMADIETQKVAEA